MKPIKRVSDPDGTKQEEESLEKTRDGLAKLEAIRIAELLRIADHFNACGIENNDQGLITYAKDMMKIVERKMKQEEKDLENIRRAENDS